MKNLETELHCRGHGYFMPHCADCHNLDRARILAEFNHLQALIKGASAELPRLRVEMFRASGGGRVFASVLEWQSGYPAWKQLAHMKAGDTFDIPQTVAIAAIAKERALRKAAEETMVYQHKGLEEETTLREEAEASIAILEEELKQYKKERAENSRHYNRLAGLLFSGVLDKLTGNDCQKWADEYVNWKQRAEAAEEELKQYKQDNGIFGVGA